MGNDFEQEGAVLGPIGVVTDGRAGRGAAMFGGNDGPRAEHHPRVHYPPIRYRPPNPILRSMQ